MSLGQLQEARDRLSEVIEQAHSKGPQIITRHGKERAVVLSIQEYRAPKELEPDFLEYLLSGPNVDDFEIERDTDTGREVSL